MIFTNDIARLKGSVLLVALCVLIPFGGNAAELGPQSVAQRGKVYFYAQDYGKAYNVLYVAFKADPADLSVNFYLGRSAFEIGAYESAIMAFDRILIMSPNSIRVKLELARCHMRLGAYEIARQYFYEVLASKPPKIVRDNVDLLLADIATAERHNFFSGMVTVGISADDNVRSAPGNFQFIFPGALGDITLDLSSSAVSDYYWSTTASLNHIYAFDDRKTSWKTSAIVLDNAYNVNHDLDIRYYGVTSGPVYQSEKYLLEVHGALHNMTLGYDDYVQPTGGGASATFIIDQNVIIKSSFELEEKRYSRTSDFVKNATNLNISLSPFFIAGDNRFTTIFIREFENAEAEYWSYERWKFGIRYDRVLPDNYSLFVGLDLKKTKYDAIKPGETVVRYDREQDYTLGVGKILWQSRNKKQNTNLQIGYTHTEVKSSISMYRYRKNFFNLAVIYGF